MSEQTHVLITGATGNLGSKLVEFLRDDYGLTLIDKDGKGRPEVVEADLSVWDDAWVELFIGVDTAVHLAADPRPDRSWGELQAPNIDATVNVYNAAIKNGVRRVIFASSNHVMGGYREVTEPWRISTDLPPLPGTRMTHRNGFVSVPYAAAKLMGERLGKCSSDSYGLSVICVRIGTVRPGENEPAQMFERYEDAWWREMWLSNRDYGQLMRCCIEADPSVRFAVINGMSNNEGMRWDIEQARRVVGYVPQDGLPRSLNGR